MRSARATPSDRSSIALLLAAFFVAAPFVAALCLTASLLAACGEATTATSDAALADAGHGTDAGDGTDARSEGGPGADGSAHCIQPLADTGPLRDGCTVPKPAPPDLLDEALAKLARDRCTASYTSYDPAVYAFLYAADPYRLPLFERTHRTALESPRFARTLASELDAALASSRPVTRALQVALHHAGFGGPVCLPPRAPESTSPLGWALARLLQGSGGKADPAQLGREVAGVPVGLQAALAPVVDALAEAAKARAASLREIDLGKTAESPGITPEVLFTYATSLALRARSGKALNPREPWVHKVLQGGATGFKVQPLYRAAVALAAAIEGADLGRFVGTAVSFSIATPIGRILLRGPGDTTYDPKDPELSGPIALLMDTGGNDTYRIPAGATSSVDNPVSVLIDLAGSDTYGYVEAPSPLDGARLPSDEGGRAAGLPPTKGDGPISLSESSRQGAGRLGIGLLFDLGTDADRYTSLRMSQGFGALGVGVLYDAGGDDRYRSEAGAQGAGIFGLGLLLDAGGNDRYETHTQAQGYGYVKGVGLLYDATGNDAYLADVGDPAQGGDPLYHSPQLPGAGNSSFVQGAGFGRRADLSDGQSMAGGLGVLRDKTGDDRYRASVFAQGTGYWYGTGVLADGAGRDTYDGLWYVQGSAAHFALALFLEDGGDDRYNAELAPRSTSIGVGHDCSVGWHLDLGGDDAYRAPNLSLGAGNDNGHGFFVNRGGTDGYVTVGKSTLGAAPQSVQTGWRPKALTLGVFVDTDGADTYRLDGQPDDRNDRSWLYGSAPAPSPSSGVGLDGAGTVDLP